MNHTNLALDDGGGGLAAMWANTRDGMPVLTFSGDDKIAVQDAHADLVSVQGTIAFWLYKDAAMNGVTGGIFHLYEVGGSTTDYLRMYKDTSERLDIVIEDDNVSKSSGDLWYNIPDDTWFHLGVRHDGTYITSFAGGIEETERASNGWWTSHLLGTPKIVVGYAWGYWEGRIADLRMYDRALSDEEFALLASSRRRM